MKNKKMVFLTLVMLVLLVFSGCTKKGTCEKCGKKAVLYRFTTTSGLLGVSDTNTSKICEECMDEEIRAIDNDGLGLTTYTYEEIK